MADDGDNTDESSGSQKSLNERDRGFKRGDFKIYSRGETRREMPSLTIVSHGDKPAIRGAGVFKLGRLTPAGELRLLASNLEQLEEAASVALVILEQDGRHPDEAAALRTALELMIDP
jgi:hypothetical protein